MNKGDVHIDKYFKEKVKTQKVEGSIPSFDAFLSNTGVETSIVTNTVVTTGVSKSLLFLIPAVVIVVGGLFYVNSEDSSENIDSKVPVLNDQSLDVESIKTIKSENIEEVTIEHVDVEEALEVKKTKKISEKSIKTEKVSLVEAEDVLDTLVLMKPENVIVLEEVIDSIEIKEQKLEAPKEPESIKETAKGLDLFMKKHLDEDEKGVDLYKEK